MRHVSRWNIDAPSEPGLLSDSDGWIMWSKHGRGWELASRHVRVHHMWEISVSLLWERWDQFSNTFTPSAIHWGFLFLYGSQKHWFVAIRRTSTLCQGPYKPVLTCAGFLLTGCGSMDLHPPFAMCTSRKKHCHCSVVNGQAFVRLLMTLSCKVFSTCTGITSNVGSCFTNILSPAYQRIPRNKKDFLCLLEFSQDVG